MADPKAPEMPEGWTTWTGDATGKIYFRLRRQSTLRLETIHALLSAHGLHMVTEADKRVLTLAPDVAANFGQPRSAELEIAFMKAVNDMLRCAP